MSKIDQLYILTQNNLIFHFFNLKLPIFTFLT